MLCLVDHDSILPVCFVLHAAKDGTPVGVVQTSRENMEAQEAFTGPGIEEGVSTIPDNKA